MQSFVPVDEHRAARTFGIADQPMAAAVRSNQEVTHQSCRVVLGPHGDFLGFQRSAAPIQIRAPNPISSAIATNNPTRATRFQGSAAARRRCARGCIGQAFDMRIAPQSSCRLGCGSRRYAPKPGKASRGNRAWRHKAAIRSRRLMDFLRARTAFAIARLRVREIGQRANREWRRQCRQQICTPQRATSSTAA